MKTPTIYNLLAILACAFALSACGAPPGSSDDSSSDNAISSDITRLAPSVNVSAENGNYHVSWDDVNATQYRVLYWKGTDAPDEFLTANNAYTLPPLSSGNYTVIVEAYDALGNSLFSTPVSVEVL